MSKEDLKDKPDEKGSDNGNGNEKKGKVTAFVNWIWNPKKKQFLGRTGSSWAKVGLFYLIFYACLALFWALMLQIFLSTITYERPKWTMETSLIGLSPGLGYRPTARVEKIDSTLIHFRPGQNASYFKWAQDVENYLKPYREQYEKRIDCRTLPTRGCPYVPDLSQHSCGPNFGYDTGSPCVLLKLNRVYNWRPNPFRSLDEINNRLKESTKGADNINLDSKIGRQLNGGEGLISIQCEGERGSDREKLGVVDYWPKQGFPAEYYPYINQPNYLSPFVLVKFNKPTRGHVINIECNAFDGNIEISRYDREGSVNFQLLIEN